MSKLIERLKTFYSDRSERNLYKSEGAVPFPKALVLGFEHVLVMLLANITPVIVVFWHFNDAELTKNAIQAGLLIAGISTILEMFPLGKLGSGLPIVAGVSFSFMGSLALVASNFDYGTMMGSLLIGGFFLTLIGFLGKYLRKIIKPIVRGIVVLSVGLGLIEEGIRQFFSITTVTSISSGGLYSFSLAWPYLIIALVSLLSGLIYMTFVRGVWKNISVTIGLLAGYLTSIVLNLLLPEAGILDFSAFRFSVFTDFINVPQPMAFGALKFDLQAIIFVCLIYLVASIEGLGDIIEISQKEGLSDDKMDAEVVGGLVTDGIFSVASVCFGSLPLTTSSQNVAYIKRTGIINKFTILIGAIMLVILGFLPPVSALLESIPEAVLGGTMMVCYLSILMIGFQMLVKAGFNLKNTTIICISIGLGYGITLLGEEFFNTTTFPGETDFFIIFLKNPEAMMFLTSFILSYIIPDSFSRKEGLDIPEQKGSEDQKVQGSDEKND